MPIIKDDKTLFDTCYHLHVNAIAKIRSSFILAPTVEELSARQDNQDYADSLRQVAEAQGLLVVVAPPVRESEKHGNSRRKRKVSGQSTGAASKTRTTTRRLVAKNKEDRSKKLHCSLCFKKRGVTETDHRANTCAHAVPMVDFVLVSDDDDDEPADC